MISEKYYAQWHTMTQNDHHSRTAILAATFNVQQLLGPHHRFVLLGPKRISCCHRWIAKFDWGCELCSCEDDPLDDQLLGIHAHNLALWPTDSNHLLEFCVCFSEYFIFLVEPTRFGVVFLSCRIHDFHTHTAQAWLANTSSRCQLRGYRLTAMGGSY